MFSRGELFPVESHVDCRPQVQKCLHFIPRSHLWSVLKAWSKKICRDPIRPQRLHADWVRHIGMDWISEAWTPYLTLSRAGMQAQTPEPTRGCYICWKKFKVLHECPRVKNTGDGFVWNFKKVSTLRKVWGIAVFTGQIWFLYWWNGNG